MIGQTIRTRLSFPWGVLFFGLLGVGLLALAVPVRHYAPALLAVLPLSLATAVWWGRRPQFVADFTPTGLQVKSPQLTIEYQRIEAVLVKGKQSAPEAGLPTSYPIDVIHDQGFLRIPAKLDMPSDTVYRFLLLHQSGIPRRHPVNPMLRDNLRRQAERYGPDAVSAFRARPTPGRGLDSRYGKPVCLAIILAGLVWAAVGGLLTASNPRGGGAGWIAGGLLTAFFGGLFWLVVWLQGRRVDLPKNWEQAGLVVGPDGLALVQGDLTGELFWDEVRDLRLREKPGGFQFSEGASHVGIHIKVEGATIVIRDLFDQPLYAIHERMKRFWRG
jgi:hypothetical protein